MGKIVAIGGGEIGRPGFDVETLDIDKKIISLSGKKSPVLLFIPTASGDSEGYCETVEKHFGKSLGCTVKHLKVVENSPSIKEIEILIESADIIYVGGGDTEFMMATWKKFNLDTLLRDAYVKGKVMSGISAGAICWFEFGTAEPLTTPEEPDKPIRVDGLGLIKGVCYPHYDVEPDGQKDVMLIAKSFKAPIFALDNCSAVVVEDDSYEIIISRYGACVRIFINTDGEISETKLSPGKTYNF